MKANSILETIGNTPHVKINKLFGSEHEVWMKLEKANPGSSIKDRIALSMIEDAEQKGLLNKDSIIIEPTSGNTGVGLALVAAVKGYKIILVMPESMSIERRRLMSLYGAEFVLTPREKGMKGAIEKATELASTTPHAWMPQQFDNPANTEIHRTATALEILEDFPDGLDYYITGVGTGGHITGVAEILKQQMIIKKQIIGKVILAGAGCGDPDLITIKVARYLQNADVVLTDRLVSKEILHQHVHEKADIIYVGKQCRRGFSTPQKSINELMVQYALEGKLVVRLKGGDVSVFSNILDELEALVLHQIPYEIIPGVSAAMGAAAYAGIPLTARGYSTAIRLLTFYKADVVTDAYWKELANTNDTLVFYMSSETLDGVVENLMKHSIAADKLLAVVEQATTPMQCVHITGLPEYRQKLSGKIFASPTLVIIGKVVALHEKFSWLKNAIAPTDYFKPVEDVHFENLVQELNKKSVQTS